MIDQIIASTQLRAEQVLFIDDNPRVALRHRRYATCG
jgi:hypothetical protein